MCSKPKAPPTPAPLPIAPPAPPTPEEVAKSVQTEDNLAPEYNAGRSGRGLNILRVPLRTSQKSGYGLQLPTG